LRSNRTLLAARFAGPEKLASAALLHKMPKMRAVLDILSMRLVRLADGT
jgi:hypothetical protein